MAELKTKENNASVETFINSVPEEDKRQDCIALIELLKKITGSEPKMWGTAIIGFGRYHYKYASGHEGDAALIGFSPRKAGITLYLTCGFHGPGGLLKQLGKHKVGKGCLYINRMQDIDTEVLSQVIKASMEAIKDHVKLMKEQASKG